MIKEERDRKKHGPRLVCGLCDGFPSMLTDAEAVCRGGHAQSRTEKRNGDGASSHRASEHDPEKGVPRTWLAR